MAEAPAPANRLGSLAHAAAHRPCDRVGLRLHRRRAAYRQPLFEQLPVAGIPAAAAEGRVVPRRHRHRHDDRHPARADRPVGAVGRRRRRHDGDGGDRLGAARRGAGDSGGHRLRHRPGAGQRRRRGVPSHSVDGRHAGGERRRARADGRAHRRLLAAGFIVAGDAIHRHRPQPVRHPQCAAGVGSGRRRGRFPADPDDFRPHRLCDRQPRACGLPLRRAHPHAS